MWVPAKPIFVGQAVFFDILKPHVFSHVQKCMLWWSPVNIWKPIWYMTGSRPLKCFTWQITRLGYPHYRVYIPNLIVLHCHSPPKSWIMLGKTHLMYKDLARTDKVIFYEHFLTHTVLFTVAKSWNSNSVAVFIYWFLSYLIFGSTQLILLTPH